MHQRGFSKRHHRFLRSVVRSFYIIRLQQAANHAGESSRRWFGINDFFECSSGSAKIGGAKELLRIGQRLIIAGGSLRRYGQDEYQSYQKKTKVQHTQRTHSPKNTCVPGVWQSDNLENSRSRRGQKFAHACVVKSVYFGGCNLNLGKTIAVDIVNAGQKRRLAEGQKVPQIGLCFPQIRRGNVGQLAKLPFTDEIADT